MDYWEADAARQGPTKRQKFDLITPDEQSCAEPAIDIEDLHPTYCGSLLRPPTVPTMLEAEFPLSGAFDFATQATGETAISTTAELKARLEGYGKVYQRHRTKIKDLGPAGMESTHAGQQPGCLIEQLNPHYFEQDKYKPHTAMNPGALSPTLFSNSDSIQDFTQFFSSNLPSHNKAKAGSNSREALFTIPELEERDGSDNPYHTISPAALSRKPSADYAVDQTADLTRPDQDADPILLPECFDWEDSTRPLFAQEQHLSMEARPSEFDTALFQTHLTISIIESVALFEGDPVLSPGSRTNSQSPVEDLPEDHITACHNCGVTKTPLWRRTPDKRHSLCNACGLYLKQYQIMRPPVPRNRPATQKKEEDGTTICTNCAATKTSLWRKDENGQVICNACGLYSKLHGTNRPEGMRKEKITRRKRYRNLIAAKDPGDSHRHRLSLDSVQSIGPLSAVDSPPMSSPMTEPISA